jgi:lipoprotein NlpI
VARFFLGQFDEAATDTSESCRLQACGPHALIWRYLCGKRVGHAASATSELLRDSEKADQGSWPGPVIELLLSRREPSAVLQAAATGDSASVSLKACEARFFLGEYHLLLGHQDQARATLQQAVEICPRGFDVDFLGRNHVLAAGAAAELKRLPP